MTRDQLFDWGAASGFPFLVLTIKPQSCVLAGRTAWYSFLCRASGTELLALERRIQSWEESYRAFCGPTD